MFDRVLNKAQIDPLIYLETTNSPLGISGIINATTHFIVSTTTIKASKKESRADSMIQY